MQSNASNDEQLYIHNYTWKKEMHILVNATIIRNAYFKEEFSKTKNNQIRKKYLIASEHVPNKSRGVHKPALIIFTKI